MGPNILWYFEDLGKISMQEFIQKVYLLFENSRLKDIV